MSTRLGDAFRLGWAGPTPEFPNNWEEQLEAFCATARAPWNALAIDDAHFARYVAERLSSNGASHAAVDAVRAEDLYLACGCAAAIPAALAHLEEQFFSVAAVTSFLRRIDTSPSFVDEVRQIVRTRMLVGEPPAPPRIRQYCGRGPLAKWLAVAVQRTALTMLRGDRARSRMKQQAVAEAFPAGADPELDYLKARYKHEFRDAVSGAIATLAPRDRLILRLRLVDKLSQERIAGMYQVNQATMSRWIAGARESISRETRDILRQRLHIDTAELESLAALVGSQLELSLTRLLGDAAGI